jgi:alpha-1,2-mannosyltransferase
MISRTTTAERRFVEQYDRQLEDTMATQRPTNRRPAMSGWILWWHVTHPVLLWTGVIAASLYAGFVYRWFWLVLRYLNYNDFGKFYYSLQQWRDSGTLYGPSPATLIPLGEGRAEHFWNMNPPHFHALLWPFVYLPIDPAFLIWAVLNVALSAVAVVAIAREIPIRGHATAWFLGIALTLISEPILAWFVTGQLTGILFAAVTWIWVAIRRGRWTAAAIAIGLVCSVKPFLGPLGLYLMIRRQWRATLVAGLTLVLAFALGFLVFGIQAHRDWLTALRAVQWTGAVMNASVYGLVSRTWALDAFSTSRPATQVAGALSALILVVGVNASWRTKDDDRALLILLATSLLASPLGWVYYLPIVIGPMLALAVSGRSNWWACVALVCLFFPHFLLWPYPSRLFAFTAGSTYTWSLIMLWVAAIRPVRRGGGATNIQPFA